ncbi:MAG: hypothetical protein JRI26_04045 [Deltaproteobacteria bacterium]|nr:hypothetical protein [Deltaproteobacteria bacterium]
MRLVVTQGTVVEPVSLERQAISCINDDEIRELVRLAKIVEIHYGGIPQDVEWAISADYPFPGNVFFLQTRSVVGVKWESKYLDNLKREKREMFSYSPLVMNRPSLMEFLFSERCRIHGRQGLS